MADDEQTIIVTQHDDDQFALEHGGALALYGDKDQPALQHEFAGQVIHRTAPQFPLVHVVGWDEENQVKAELSGRVTLVGDEEMPLQVRMVHEFANTHNHSHEVHLQPVDHTLKVNTKLHEPIHHALQLRTPVQLRFCNPWHVGSDYTIEFRLAGFGLISIRVTGATTVTPQPCEGDEPCPPAVISLPGNP
jgi:hypothetical protein